MGDKLIPSPTAVFEFVLPRMDCAALRDVLVAAGETDGYKPDESSQFFAKLFNAFGPTGSNELVAEFLAAKPYPVEHLCHWYFLQDRLSVDRPFPVETASFNDETWRQKLMAGVLLLYGYHTEERGIVDIWYATGIALQAAIKLGDGYAESLARFIEWTWVKEGGHASRNKDMFACAAARVVLPIVTGIGNASEPFDDLMRYLRWRDENMKEFRGTLQSWMRQSPREKGLEAWPLGDATVDCRIDPLDLPLSDSWRGWIPVLDPAWLGERPTSIGDEMGESRNLLRRLELIFSPRR